MATSFLNLTNKLLRRLNEVEIEQADFSSVRGVQAMAKDAINASIEEIMQAEITWPFNATSTTQVLTVGQEAYTWPTNLKVVNWESFHINKDDTIGNNGSVLKFISRDSWHMLYRDLDEDSETEGRGLPVFVFENNVGGFAVTPSPDEAYTVYYEYYVNATTLSAYGDTSLIPSNYDETIIQGGLYHFYMFRDNTAQADRAMSIFEKRVKQMRTILINNEDTMRSRLLVRRSNALMAVPNAGWYM